MACLLRTLAALGCAASVSAWMALAGAAAEQEPAGGKLTWGERIEGDWIRHADPLALRPPEGSRPLVASGQVEEDR